MSRYSVGGEPNDVAVDVISRRELREELGVFVDLRVTKAIAGRREDVDDARVHAAVVD